MDLRQQLEFLMLLQSTGEDIARLEKDRALLQKDIDQQTGAIEELQRQSEATHQERIAKQKEGDALEVKIRSAAEQNQKLRLQLNTTKNQRDYDAILRTIMNNEADASKWEDEEIELLEAVDELKAEEARVQSEIAEEKNKLEDIRRRVEESRKDYDARIHDLEKKKNNIRKQIDPALLSKFDQLSNSRNRNALAEVSNRICGGCFTQVPKQIENQLMRWDKPVFCHSCGRLLILAESSVSGS